MRPSSVALFLCLLPFWSTLHLSGAEDRIRVAPIPAWVRTDPAPAYDAPVTENTQRGFQFLLLDHQTQVDEAKQYEHFTYRLTSTDALQAGGQIAVTYDPAYETIDFHFIRVHRDGESSNRLDLTKIKMIQREQELDRQLYNGQLTALMVLDDLRVGDVIDYALTRNGRNPIFKGIYDEVEAVNWSSPIEYERVRLLAKSSRQLAYKEHGKAPLKFNTREIGDLREYTWEAEHLPPVSADPEAPAWYQPYSFLQFSEFPNWSAVKTWALPLYTVPGQLPERMCQKVDQLTATCIVPEEKVLAILDFVQKEIRYLGLEVGPNTHRPSPPEDVFDRRFGDCKDKTLLLCALLNYAGVRATPALTHSTRQAAMKEWLPSASLFDHVVARIQLGSRTYWVDSTMTNQAGRLDYRSAADFGLALPIEADAQALQPIVVPPTSRPSVQVEENFISSAFELPARWTIVAAYHGPAADAVRAYVTHTPKDEVAKTFLNFRQRIYPKLIIAEPPRWRDDPVKNIFTVYHHYSIPEFWAKTEGQELLRAEFYPLVLRDHVLAPSSPTRSAPLALSFPLTITQDTTIQLPTAWPEAHEHRVFSDSGFKAGASVEGTGRTLKLNYRFETLRDSVAPEAVPTYLEALKSFRDQLDYSLTYNPAVARRNAHFRMNWMLLIFAAGVVGASVGAAIWIYRRRWRSRSSSDQSRDPDLAGLGGWLVLVGIGITVRPVYMLFIVTKTFSRYFDARIWENITTHGIKPLLMTEIGCNLLTTVACVLAAAGYYGRKRFFPPIFIGYLCFLLAFLFIDAAWAASISPTLSARSSVAFQEIARSLIASAIWVPYMIVSRRVKATFTR